MQFPFVQFVINLEINVLIIINKHENTIAQIIEHLCISLHTVPVIIREMSDVT